MNTKNTHKFTKKVTDTLPKKIADNKTAQAVLEVAGIVEEKAEHAMHSFTDFLGSIKSVAEVMGPEAVRRAKKKVESLKDMAVKKVDTMKSKRNSRTAKVATVEKPKAKRKASAKKTETKAKPAKVTTPRVKAKKVAVVSPE